MEPVISVVLRTPPIWKSPNGQMGSDFGFEDEGGPREIKEVLTEDPAYWVGDMVYTANELEHYALGILWMIRKRHGLRNEVVV